MSSSRPVTPDPLREFLRGRFSSERLRRVASADFDRDGQAIADEFRRNLETGAYTYDGDGNPYECALMQKYDTTPDRPLNELFGAWWLGTFCSDPEHFVLIDNLGVESVLHMAVRGCAGLGPEAAEAAHAALPFVAFLHSRTPFTDDDEFFRLATRALEALERLGTAGTKTGRYQEFIAATGDPDEA